MTRSDTAKRRGIDNTPTQEHTINMMHLGENIYDKVREHFNVPIYVSSGYRSEKLNSAMKGASNSQHCTGQAMDLDMDGRGISNKDIFRFIADNLLFDQLIWEFGTAENPDWVHVSYKNSGNRGQVLKAVKGMLGTKYVPM